ncbi:methionyl-tRNA formyltransferase [Clostridiisalibacter paucivorans]|uniref:methionyl-tRNA formyltransferase n=1 Tax=Clostridiisalibacter paucivorans TaxID=408753 RepID=UPI00047D7592|nr:methionyl-tRNA formyltransferase [Clostridiisalibacter paucivorans]
MKVIFMGTPDFAVPTLKKIYEHGDKIDLVITQPDKPKGRGKKFLPTPVKKKALELGLEVYQPKSVNNEESISLIRSLDPDIIVVVAYGQILKEDILNIPRLGCVNVHASLLPKYRGAAPINWAIINGEHKTGVTTMFMAKGLDSGDMLLKKEVDILEDTNAEQLHDELMNEGAKLLIDTMEGLNKKTIIPEPQEHKSSTYAPMLNKELGHINWNKNCKDIRNLIRGTNPWPSAYFIYNDIKVKVFDGEIIEKNVNESPGKIVDVDDNGIYIKCLDYLLLIKEIQFPGKKRMAVKDYLRGNEIKKNILLK